MSDRERSTGAAKAAPQRARGDCVGFWGQTGRRVGQVHKSQLQSRAAEHPIAFAALWVAKWLVWDAPRGLGRLIAARAAERRNRRAEAAEGLASVSSIEDAGRRR